MKILFASVALVLIYTRLSLGQPGCDPVICLAIEYPPSCKVSVFTEKDGLVCQVCDACIEKNGKKDENGCPLRGCPAIAIPAECKRRRYYTFGEKTCDDCPENAC